MRRKTRRRGGVRGWLVAILILIPILWVGYWFAAHTVANAAVDRITSRPVGGGRIACTAHSLGGFPLRLDFGCDRAAYADVSGQQVSAELASLKASAPLYWPGYVETRLGSPFVVNAPGMGVALTAQWSAASTTTSAGLGGLQSAGAAFDGLDFASTGSAELPLRNLRATRAEAFVEPAGGNSYRLAAFANDLQVLPADGRTIPPFSTEARIVALDFASSLGTDPRETVLHWLRTGGTANVERLKLTTGDAGFDADGQLTLGPDGVLAGKLNLRLRNPEAFGDFAEAIRPGTREKLEQILPVLMALTIPVNTPDGPARQTALIIRKGVVSIGIVPIGTIPPLKF